MIKECIAYLKDNPRGYWFKAKLYGWGWVPVKWQGWLGVVIGIAILGKMGSGKNGKMGSGEKWGQSPFIFIERYLNTENKGT